MLDMGVNTLSASTSFNDINLQISYAMDDSSAWITFLSGALTIGLVTLGIALIVLNQLDSRRKNCILIEYIGFPEGVHGHAREGLGHKFLSQNLIQSPIHICDSNEKQVFEISSVIERAQRQIKTYGAKENHPIFAGVAPVPYLIHAGHEWGNHQFIDVMDYKRGESEKQSSWHMNGDIDDLRPLKCTTIPEETFEDKEIIVGIALSMPLDVDSMREEFSGQDMYIIQVDDDDMELDNVCSAQMQSRFAKEIINKITKISKKYPKLERMNLFVTGQASLVFRLGTQLRQNHMPVIVIYQYDRTARTKHNWGIELHCNQENKIIKPALAT